MSSFVSKIAVIKIGGNSIAPYLRECTISGSVEIQEDTHMGDSAKTKLPGLKDAKISMTVNDDVGSGALDSIIWGIWSNNVAVTFSAWPNGSSTSTSNPRFQGSIILTEYPFMDAKIGQLATKSLSWEVTGTVTRATS